MWTTAAEKPYQQLKLAFMSAPILEHPDPEKPFTVKVDTSDTGVGAVLSQRFGDDQKNAPCSKVGNRELLAIKPALEE